MNLITKLLLAFLSKQLCITDKETEYCSATPHPPIVLNGMDYPVKNPALWHGVLKVKPDSGCWAFGESTLAFVGLYSRFWL